MDFNTSETSYAPRSKKKPKRKRLWRNFIVILLIILLSGGGLLYGTDQGLQFRRLMVGSVLSTQHAKYVKYLRFLLSKKDFDELVAAWGNPSSHQTKIKKQKETTHVVKAAEPPSLSVRVDTVDTINYTAKILVISDPKTVHVVASSLSNKGQPLSDLIKENNGIAGINGGGFYDPAGNGSGGQPLGMVISNGKVLATPGGNSNATALVGAILKDGQFISGKYSANELINLGVMEAISFGPQLIVNGKSNITSAVDGAWGWAPRTALGQAKDGSIIMIITDGRFYWDKTHRGASMSDMVHMFEKYNVTNAIAMDGGGSTTMIKDGELQLKPATSTRVGMRYLPNAWIVIPN